MKTPKIMYVVLAALLPGIIAMTSVWGVGVLINVILLSCCCVAIELACLALRGAELMKNWRFHLSDGSALVTAWLIAICIPPFAGMDSLGLILVAAIAAIAMAKHAYGGLGRNTFNPAMVGYAVVLISYPAALGTWPPLVEAATGQSLDALSGATLLSEYRFRTGLTENEFSARFAVAIAQQQTIAATFALGGGVLLYLKLVAWRIPLAILISVGICAMFGYDSGSSFGHGSAWFHWINGGLIAAAFFIATDPVTHPNSPRDQIIFGVIVGVTIYVIRAFGAFPDGIAFAILFANCTTPMLNRLKIPASHAHS